MRILNVIAAALGVVGVQGKIPEEDGVKSIALRTHTLVQPYLDSEMTSRWFDFGGHTIIRTDAHVRLTSDLPSQTGWLWSKVPLTATNWEVEVEFKISGRNQLYGDGMAMWITKDRATAGSVFGAPDRFEGLGIFLDTYKNNRPGVVFPYVMAMHGDGQTRYDEENDGKNTQLNGCSARGIRGATIPTKMRVTYFQDKLLRLELQYKNEGEWTQCFEMLAPPQLPQVTYLGFSAKTGELSDNHDIVAVRTKNLYRSATSSTNTGGNGSSSSRQRLAHPEKKGSWTWFIIKLLGFVVLLSGGYIGFKAWRANQARKSHRF